MPSHVTKVEPSRPPLRLIFDARTCTPQFPGIGRYAANLLHALSEVEPDLRLTLLTGPGVWIERASLLAAVARRLQVREHRLGFGVFAPGQGVRLRAVLNRLQGDVFHAPYLMTPTRLQMPVLITLHDLIPLRFPRYSALRARLAYRFLGLRALRRADGLICVSEASAADARALLGQRLPPLRVIGHGVRQSYRPAGEEARAILRERYGLPPSFLLYIGSDRPHKNLQTLIAAVEAAGDAAPPLVVAGFLSLPRGRLSSARGPRRNLSGQGRLIRLGHIPEADLPLLYAAARMVALPSLAEGFGLPALEAMACGTPLLCADIPALREVAGDAAIFIAPRDRAAWSRAIAALNADADRRKTLSEAGLEQARNRTWTQAARKTLDYYRSMRDSCLIPPP